MIPKIIFRYSSIHDYIFRHHLETSYKANKEKSVKKNLKEYPSRSKIENYIAKVKIDWKKEEKRILNMIPRITGLKFHEDRIIVYVVGYCAPYSNPVTMRLYKNKKDFVDVLTHALIHQIEHQNSKIFKKWLSYMDTSYKKETRGTKKHLVLHSVHKEILMKLGGSARLKRILKRGVGEGYLRAMEIVDQEGSKNLLKKFRKVAQIF